jgi:two-component system response regulator ResD
MTVREHRPLAADAVAAGRLGLPWTVSAASPSHVRGNVLVVEDEPTIADVVSRYLRRAGYRTRVAGDGERALEAFDEDRPDLLVLDIMLPRIDGLEVMRRIRQRGRERVAVILLTAKGEELDRICGLRLGADDYIVKPFSPGELVARVDAVLRRVAPEPGDEPPLRFDGLIVDPAGRRVLRDGEELALTQLEFDLLLYLARHPGRAFSREKLMDAVWQYSFYSDTSTVTVHIRRLRAKVEPDPAHPRWVETVWGVGYRFQP